MSKIKILFQIIKWLVVTAGRWIISNIPKTKYQVSLLLNALVFVYIAWMIVFIPVVLAQSKKFVVIKEKIDTKSEVSLQTNPKIGSEEWIKERWEEAGAEWEEVWAVTQGESRWDENAFNCNTNGSVDLSWYQLNSVHIPGRFSLSCAADPICSTREAIKLWQEQGWTPWVAARSLGIN